MSFEQLQIIKPIYQAITEAGYQEPTPIQEQAIPILLQGQDILASAQTGTGKTAAFAIPIIQMLPNSRGIKALILAPTRELAVQIYESFRIYTKYLNINTAVVYGGVSIGQQIKTLRKGVDILIATPGRLLDLKDQKLVDLRNVKFFVLDEADRMMDMGFIIDVKRIAREIPEERQTMLFSATLPDTIIELSETLLKNPVRIAISPEKPTIDAIKQAVFFVSKSNKINLLLSILNVKLVTSALIFTRTKYGANLLLKELQSYKIKADAIHGDKTQAARTKALNDFKNKKIKVLVATDIASRGLDIEELSHVINYDIPEDPETYIHRIGRTGRAGLSGTALSFCSEEEIRLLKSIEKHLHSKINVIKDHPFAIDITDLNKKKKPKYRKKHRNVRKAR
ncbi:MAG TPA: DEAD/DEAH box helicase [Bacilli bacterium]